MKKFYYSLFAAASMMLAVTSCSQEEDFVQSSSEMTTFSVQLDGATQSRTAGDGKTVDKLYYAVYSESTGEVVYPAGAQYGTAKKEDGGWKLDLPLMKSETYDILFWAQKDGSGAYEFTNLKEVTVKYDGVLSNKEDRDAFFNALDGFKASGSEHTIVLRRPFAQLNVATTIDDWTKAKTIYNSTNNTTGVNPVSKSAVTVSALATKFNVLTGEASVPTTGRVTFGANTLLDESIKIKRMVEGVEKDVEYKLLAMNYLLPKGTKKPNGLEQYNPEEGKENTEVEFTLYKGTDDQIVNVKVPATPIQRNWRTNIIGDLLTGEGFDVVIEEGFDNEENQEIEISADGIVKDADGFYHITTTEGLWNLARLVNNGSQSASTGGRAATVGYTFEGEKFVLDCDIDLAGAEWTPIGSNGAMFSGTFDGNGKTVSNFKVDVEEMGGLFGNVRSAKIKNLKVQTANIKSTHFAGGIAAHGVCAEITGCTVEDITITVNPNVKIGNDYNGDKAGGIIGYLSGEPVAYVKNSTATKVTIQAYRDFGGIVGYANKSSEVSTCSVDNIVLTIDNSNNYKNYSSQAEYDAGAIVGEAHGSATVSNEKPDEDTYEIIYTAGTEYPGYYQDANGKYIVTEDKGITALIGNGQTEINLADGSFKMPTDAELKDKELTFTGSRNAELDLIPVAGNFQKVSGATLSFNGITVKYGTQNYQGMQHTKAVTYNDCAINGLQFLYAPTTFTNCELNSNGAEHCVWTYGADKVTFTDCTFTYGDRAVNCYSDQSGQATKATFTDCTFTKVAGKPTSGAIETNSSLMTGLELTINNCKVNEGDLWWISSYDELNGANTVVTVDGLTYVAENLWKNQAGEYVANTPDALVAIFNYMTIDDIHDVISIEEDLDMTGKTINATKGNVGFTLKGNNKTISNLKGTEAGLFVNNTGSAKYKFYNVKLQGCSVESSTNYGALFVGDADTCDELIIEGCEVNNCTVKSNKYAAAFVGYTAGYNVQNNGPVYSDVTIKNCKVVGGSINGGGSTAAAIGHAGGNVDTTNKIENLNVSGVAINGEDAAHTGIVVGTANVGKTYITDATYNNVTGNYNTEHPLFGRFVPGSTGELTIDNKQIITDNSQLAAAIKDNATIELGKGNYTLPNDQVLSGKTLTISGTKETVIATGNGNGSYANLGGANITFEGVTIKGQESGQYNGFAHAGEMTYKNCTFEGTITIYSNTTFEECTFNLPKGCYVWTSWGASEVTYEKCTFNTAGKALLMYHENGTSTLNVNNCTFNATASDKAGAIANQSCAAIEIDNSGKGVGTNTACNFTLNTSGNTIDNKFSGEWRIKTIDTAGLIKVNNKAYTTLALDGKTMTIDSSKNVTVNE